MEISVLADRIIHDIYKVFDLEANLDEFDIIPIFESQNKSPVIHIGKKLALEAWCVKFVYLHVYNHLMEWREKKIKADDAEVIKWSEIALLLNPDFTTAWNVRKEYFMLGKLSFSNEMRLSQLVITRKPKSPEVFIHRRWLISRLLNEPVCPDNPRKECVAADELLLCTVASSRYPNNYCAWSHREWVHETITIKYLDIQVLFDELKWNETYIHQHVSDHSGLQFRQYLLKIIANLMIENPKNKYLQQHCQPLPQNVIGGCSQESDDCESTSPDSCVANLLYSELNLIRRLICDFPDHEALWYHNRSVVYMLHSMHLFRVSDLSFSYVVGPLYKKTRTDPIVVETALSCPTGSDVDKLDDELRFVNHILAQDPQQHLALGHKRWLVRVFGLDSC